jgi:hypothetical protein
MTTTVTIETHNWPAEVIFIDHVDSPNYKLDSETTQIVKPNSKVSFAITDTRAILFAEMPLPETEA